MCQREEEVSTAVDTRGCLITFGGGKRSTRHEVCNDLMMLVYTKIQIDSDTNKQSRNQTCHCQLLSFAASSHPGFPDDQIFGVTLFD